MQSLAVKLEFGGDLTIVSVSSIYNRLSTAILDSSSIEISVDDDSDVDVSFVQLIESARIAADRNGVALALSSPAAGQLLNTLERGGFLGKAGGALPFWRAES